MGIRRLFFETIIILTFITLVVVTLNSYQVHKTSDINLRYLQKEYLNATFEIYRNELEGDILLGNRKIIQSLLNEISIQRGVGVVLRYKNELYSTVNDVGESAVSRYDLNLGNEQFAKLSLYPMKNLRVPNFIQSLFFPLLLALLVLTLGFLWLLQRINDRLLNPLKGLVHKLSSDAIESFSAKHGAVYELNQLAVTLQKMTVDLRIKAKYEAESKTAKQVAHDIRSPLACLNLLLSYSINLPEKQRILMRSSIQRITDIANLLQTKAKKFDLLPHGNQNIEIVMISSLLELIVTEKRMQLGLATNIRIDLYLDRSYGLFASLNAVEFRRLVSNLIDNSLESFDMSVHRILITVESNDNNIQICVEDDGCGIPKEVIKSVGIYGFSYGKDHSKSSGSGIGVHHAKNAINSLGGSLVIDSVYGKGTIIKIQIPRAKPPEWFVAGINLNASKQVFILDDDDSIHNLWSEKFGEIKSIHPVKIRNMKCQNEFSQVVLAMTSDIIRDSLFLIDYEFVNQEKNGLDIASDLKIHKSAILVTSHYDDVDVRMKAIQLGVKMVPKSVVSYIPIF